MTDQNKPPLQYVYCIIRCPEPREFNTRGVGERGDVVHTLHYRELAAVLSDSVAKEYDNSRRNMMAHMMVLEEVMKEFTILPVRFGTVAPTTESVVGSVLRRRYDELSGLLVEMDGRIEMGLKAFWYEEVIFKEIIETNPPIRQLRDKLVGRSPEQSYYDRIRLGEMIASAMDRQRDIDAELILSRLRPFVHKTVLNKTITDRMILNAAFLTSRECEPDMDRTVQDLDARMGNRVVFKYVGSVPPYNFVNIVLHV
ncbi:MAG: GvpL/GvpF family gas vesicle protein [Chloroflexi bacterium]|nr:GvpL/GvpF family gas vesicle protein [Chloroflexota bacterium]